MKPNFLIIGAARSGTTSLYKYLNDHPQIVISEIKELNYFSRDKYWRKGFAWYEKNFVPKNKSTIIFGEASTSYSQAPYSPNVPKRIFSYNPEIKLIYVVRDPIERLISHFMQRTKAGLETREFYKLLENLDDIFYVWQGKYYYQLSQYLHYFKKEQIHIITFDDLIYDIDIVIYRLFEYLGVRQFNLGEKINIVHNASGKIIRKNIIGLSILNIYHTFIEQRKIPYFIKGYINMLANLGGVEIKKPNISDEQKGLLLEYYKEDLILLTKEFGINTNQWIDKYI